MLNFDTIVFTVIIHVVTSELLPDLSPVNFPPCGLFIFGNILLNRFLGIEELRKNKGNNSELYRP